MPSCRCGIDPDSRWTHKTKVVCHLTALRLVTDRHTLKQLYPQLYMYTNQWISTYRRLPGQLLPIPCLGVCYGFCNIIGKNKTVPRRMGHD